MGMAMLTNVDEAFQRELDKEEIKREITTNQPEEEKVRREIVSKRAFKIPMQTSEGILHNNFNMFGGSTKLRSYFMVDNRQTSAHINNDKARPNVAHYNGKCKAITSTTDDNESFHNKGKKHKVKASMKTQKIGKSNNILSSLKKSKHQVKFTKIIVIMYSGLDSRPKGQTLHP
ncbi:hypothetical protein HKD37_08G020873 [Glycine soja]